MRTAKPVNYDFKIVCNKNSYVIYNNNEQLAEATEIIEAFVFIATLIRKKDMKSYKIFIVLCGIKHQFVDFDPDGIIDMYKQDFIFDEEADEADIENYDDQELTKDLMLDEVISSQHREIERLMNIVQDLVTTNLRLVEIIGLKK